MELELKIICATDLNKTSPFTKNKPYVVVSISNESQKTPIDTESGRNPNWNHLLTFSFPDPSSLTADLTINFHIRSGCSIVGEVSVPLSDLLNSGTANKFQIPAKFVSYQVKKPSGRPQGVLTFSYRFVDKFSRAEEKIDCAVNPEVTSSLYPVPEDVYPPLQKPSPEVTGYPAVDGYRYDVYPPPPALNTSYGYPVQGGNGYGYPGYTVNEYSRYPVQGGNGYGYPGI